MLYQKTKIYILPEYLGIIIATRLTTNYLKKRFRGKLLHRSYIFENTNKIGFDAENHKFIF